MQAYQDEEYFSLLYKSGFEDINIFLGWLGKDPHNDLMAITARKKAGVIDGF
jgi:hypothetical protein